MASTSELKITLRAKLDNEKFEAVATPNVISASVFLTNLTNECQQTDTTLDVNMTSKQLRQFITFFEHYPTASTPKDHKFETKFFKAMPDNDLFALCKAIDFFDCDRFNVAVAEFIAKEKIPKMNIPELRNYLGIVNDFP